MNPKLLKQLAMVVKQGSLSGACEQLYVTQPTLTRSIKQLEMKVGAPLLKRTRYGVVPTEIGARLSQIGEQILAETYHAEEVIRQFHSGYHSEFVLGIDPLWEFATYQQMASSLLEEKRYVFHFRTGSAAAQIELLQQGKLDFLLAPAHLSVGQRALNRELLFRDRSGVFAGKKSKLINANKPIAPDLLAKQAWMVAGANAGFLDGQGELAGPQAAKVAFTSSIRSVLYLLNTTDMLVRLPARLALMTGEIDPEQMLEIEGQEGPRRDIALWTLTDEAERPDMIKVRDILSDFVKRVDAESPLFGLNV